MRRYTNTPLSDFILDVDINFHACEFFQSLAALIKVAKTTYQLQKKK